MTATLRGAFAALCFFLVLQTDARAAELIMTNQRACTYCSRFEHDLGRIYAQTDAGKVAPIRRVSRLKKWPEDLAGVTPAFATPVFILVDNGREIGRFSGYNGVQGFWERLTPLLAKL